MDKLEERKRSDIFKMIRADACQKIGNHDYVVKTVNRAKNKALYECVHCKEWWVTTIKTNEELHRIAMRTNKSFV